jgi:hypothetical protein
MAPTDGSTPLSGRERRLALGVLGPERLDDLLPLLARLPEDFRADFIAELAGLAPGRGDAVAVAFARAALDPQARLSGGRR